VAKILGSMSIAGYHDIFREKIECFQIKGRENMDITQQIQP
jgi:hypothetical protein